MGSGDDLVFFFYNLNNVVNFSQLKLITVKTLFVQTVIVFVFSFIINHNSTRLIKACVTGCS